MTDYIEFHERDRATLREVGTLLDQLDALDDQEIANLLPHARLTYLGSYCAGLADRPPAVTGPPVDAAPGYRVTLDPGDARDSGRSPVLGHCPHGVDLDREFCPHGCRV